MPGLLYSGISGTTNNCSTKLLAENTMFLSRERTVFICATIISTFFLLLASYISSRQKLLDETASQHSFDRTIVISSENSPDELYGDDARKLITSGPNVADGALALLSRDTLAEILKLVEVKSVMAISKSSWQLTLENKKKITADVFTVPPEFMEKFNLGEPSTLALAKYVASNQISRKLGLVNRAPVIISIPDDFIAALPSEMRASTDWSHARFSSTIDNAALNLPRETTIFENVVFTTGKQQKFEVPGLFLLPKVNVLVQFSDKVDIQEAQDHLVRILEKASTDKVQLEAIPFSKYFAEEIGAEAIANWATRLRVAFFCTALMLVALLALARYHRLRYEIALRRALGAALNSSVWLSIRPTINSVLSGMIMGSVLGSVAAILAIAQISLLKELTTLALLTVLAILVIAASARLGAVADVNTTVRTKP